MKRNRTTKFLLLLLSLCLLAGCGTSTREIDLQAVAAAAQETSEPTEDPRPFLDEFIALLNANDFGSCYAMLAPGTQEAVTLVDFSERYENIFSAIELTARSWAPWRRTCPSVWTTRKRRGPLSSTGRRP